MINACIFDLDGTLALTLESLARPINRTLQHFGLPEMPRENFRYYIGNGLDTALRRALADAGDPEGRFLAEGIPLCRGWFQADPLYGVTPYPHIPPLLTGLRDRGVSLAVCTNKLQPGADAVIEHLFGPDLFQVVLGQTDLLPLKPDPAGVRSILRRLGAAPEACLYLGDSGTDMETAKNAGVTALGVTWGYRDRQELQSHGADRLIDDPLEVLDLVDAAR